MAATVIPYGDITGTDNGHYSSADGSKATDGNVSVNYSTNNADGYADYYLQYDLGAEFRVTKFRLYGGSGNVVEPWDIRYSTDNITYTQLFQTMSAADGSGWNDFEIPATDAQYWRFYKTTGNAYRRIYELDVWEDSSATLGEGLGGVALAGQAYYEVKVGDWAAQTTVGAPYNGAQDGFEMCQDYNYYITADPGTAGYAFQIIDWGKTLPFSKVWIQDGVNVPNYKLQGSANGSDWVDITGTIVVSGDTEETFSVAEYRYTKLVNTNTASTPRMYWNRYYIDTDAYIALYAGAPAAAGGLTVEYGDTLLKALQTAGATSKEVVGALNELNGTSGVEFDLAYRTYVGA